MKEDEREELIARIRNIPQKCDHCKESVHRDINGWYVGENGASDCEGSPNGHTVKGSSR